MTENGDAGAQVVLDFYAAVRDRRIADILALVDQQVVCHPLVRPGLSVYRGQDGIIRLSEDMHALHGQYDFEMDQIIEDGDKITAYARILPETGLGQQELPVMSVYILRDGLILSIESQPGISRGHFNPQPPSWT